MNCTAIFVSLVGLCSAGCASGFAKYYESQISRPIEQHDDVVLPEGPPTLVTYTSAQGLDRHGSMLRESGYLMLGSSSFTGRLEWAKGAADQGRSVKAEIVLVCQEYLRTESSNIPITTYDTVTTNHSGRFQGDSYSPGGYYSGTYSGTSTSQVPTTTYYPVSTDYYFQRATYWIRTKRALHKPGEPAGRER